MTYENDSSTTARWLQGNVFIPYQLAGPLASPCTKDALYLLTF
jgi:hypothetical protein